jgi:hypothetical protein
MKKILTLLLLIILPFGCTTTTFNIKSANELNGKKLLTGRFVFYINDIHLKGGEGFTVFFKEKQDKTLRRFKPDEKGYVYVPVDEGQYYINRIVYSKLNANIRFPVSHSSGINIDSSDTVVNIGTIHINFYQDIKSRIGYITTYGYPYAGKFIPSALKPELIITHVPDWDVTRKYISSQLNISPGKIRYEVVDFPEEVVSSFR